MDDRIKELLQSDSPRKRVVGLVQVARRRLHEGATAATLALGDPDDEVRAAAAWALDVLNRVEALPALMAALYDKVFAVRSSAGWALVHLGEAGHAAAVCTVLRDLLWSAQDAEARQMARLVLGHLGSPEATAILQDAPDVPVLH